MARSKHQQRIAQQWIPPEAIRQAELTLSKPSSVASATECTGLEARPVSSDAAAESCTQLYGIHAQKPQGNIGKGNPRNDPSEREFHRTKK